MKNIDMSKSGRLIGSTPVITFHEKKVGKTLYRVTSVYKGDFSLEKALEDLTVRKILRSMNESPQCQC